MKKENRRRFIRQITLTVGALTIGVDVAPAFFYQKKTTLRKPPDPAGPGPVDFRYAPAQWHSPIRHPGEPGQSFIARSGGLLTPGDGPAPDGIDISIEGAGEITALSQRCEEPHEPVVRTFLSYGSASAEMMAFSSADDDEGSVDNITISVTPADRPLSLRLVVRSARALTAEFDEDDDLPRGTVCIVSPESDSDHPFLVLDAKGTATREGDALVLTIPVVPSAGSASETFRIRVPRGKGDRDDIVEGSLRLVELADAGKRRWAGWKSLRMPAGWEFPGDPGRFGIASARIIDQLSPPVRPVGETSPGATAPASLPPDLVDEHFISEAELYLGRDREAKARLEAVWNLEDSRGMVIGAGGESNMKEMCAAVYSLCRHAEATGDWTMFNELYHDAFNAIDTLRQMRDTASAGPSPSANGRRKLLPEGSPGRGWEGLYEEMTNSLWALIAVKPLLDISDRHFLVKKSQLREFYGQLRLAFVTTARETMQKDPAGFSWFPLVSAVATGAAGSADAPIRPQSALGTLALGLFPGLLFKKDDVVARDFPSIVNASLREDIPFGTGPGSADRYDPVDAALAAQSLAWFGFPEEARKIFVGCLNHASPVFTWTTPAWRSLSGPAGAGGVDLRSSAESVRYLRHAMVMEDEAVLRLFDGVAKMDMAEARPLRIERTPTRWGRVSVSLEPVDARTWKITYLREPVNAAQAPPLTSVELPRVLGPNFRFDTISPGTAIKNGPRVTIDGAVLRWEAMLRDLRR